MFLRSLQIAVLSRRAILCINTPVIDLVKKLLLLLFLPITLVYAFAVQSDVSLADPVIQECADIGDKFIRCVESGSARRAATFSFERADHSETIPVGLAEIYVKKFNSDFGNVLERRLVSAEIKTTEAGMPDGKYIQLTYHTRCTKKDRLTETILLKADPPQKGKIIRYVAF